MKETLPYDFMAEDAVLGSIITNADVYDSVASYLSDEEVFYQQCARGLWQKIKKRSIVLAYVREKRDLMAI